MQGEGYTALEVEQILTGIAGGLSYMEIWRQFPGRSYTAVGNKIRRLGLTAQKVRKAPSPKSQRDALRRAGHELERSRERERARSNPRCDEAFQSAMRKAISAGLERVEEGVSIVPCTENPVFIRPEPILFSRSASLMCTEVGDAPNAY